MQELQRAGQAFAKEAGAPSPAVANAGVGPHHDQRCGFTSRLHLTSQGVDRLDAGCAAGFETEAANTLAFKGNQGGRGLSFLSAPVLIAAPLSPPRAFFASRRLCHRAPTQRRHQLVCSARGVLCPTLPAGRSQL
ncbi:hypothetical protein PHYPSEUDO_000296, partial [Phytophthora pseudosyringae]